MLVTRLVGFLLVALLFYFCCFSSRAAAQSGTPAWQAEWEKTVARATNEGKVVVSVPASSEFRKATTEAFRKRFGIDAEMITGRAATIVRRIADGIKSDIHEFDVHIGGSSSLVSGLLPDGLLEPVSPWLILPEVREPKNWWGGHMWVDRDQTYIYSSQAYLTDSIWYNSSMVRPEEIRSYNDLLQPSWSGKIGFLDPRTPGAGDSTWAHLWKVKGEEYLKKLVAQKLFISRDQRVLAENLARGTSAMVLGLVYYSYLPFIKAGLPIKPLPIPKEGTYGTGGSGNLAILKKPPHPNATKVFVNWFLGKEGQEIFTRIIGQGTRRLDVDTKSLKEIGVVAAKDQLTIEKFLELENQSEERLQKVRGPASILAEKLLR